MKKLNITPKSWLIPLITSLWQLLETLIKKLYKCQLQGLPGKFSNQFILFKTNKRGRTRLNYKASENK